MFLKYFCTILFVGLGCFNLFAQSNKRIPELKQKENLRQELTQIPYLTSILKDGRTPKKLPLTYANLTNTKAKITYKLNGKTIIPQDNHLLLTSDLVRNKLEVFIDEGNNKTWHLVYLIALIP